MSLIKELQRRNVFRVAAAYVVVAWLLIQVGATLEPAMHLPEWTDSILAFFLLLGFPIAIFFAWAYELTPDGLKRDGEADLDESTRLLAGRKWDRMIMVMMALALGYFAVDKYLLRDELPTVPEIAQSTPDHIGESPESINKADAQPQFSSKSIAVLPFVNMSSDPEQEYFSDGLTEELLNLLAGIEDLKVAARTSSFFYKDKMNTITMKEVAEQLEVAHILEGSVRKGGGKIRITAQLIKADDGFHLWSETYDRELDDVFAIQDEISAKVVDSLKVTLLGEAPHAKVLDTESYELALEGRFLFNRRGPGELKKSLELFERAVGLDPNNATAWLHLAPLYRWVFDPPKTEEALQASTKAVELEPENPEAQARHAQALFQLGRNEEGDLSWTRARELGTHNSLVLSMMAGGTFAAGFSDRGVELQRRAISLDPLHIVNVGNMAAYMLEAGRFEEAIEWVQKLEQLDPGSKNLGSLKAHIALFAGDAQKAERLLPETVRYSDGSNIGATEDDKLLAINIQYSLGNVELAATMLEDFISENGELWPVSVAYGYAWQGNSDKAFEWLDRSIEKFPNMQISRYMEPWLTALHQDARWAKIEAVIKKYQEEFPY